MRLVSFDVFRTLGFPNISHLKPEHFFRYKEELRSADWVLYPDYWQLNALHYGLKCRIFPSVPTYLIGHNKIEMTRAFESVAPRHVPYTLIAANTPYHQNDIWHNMNVPFVAKLPKASMGEGVWLIESHSDWVSYCSRTDVLYAQEYLSIDRDLRIVIVGNTIVTAYWRRQAKGRFHNNVSRGGFIEYSAVPPLAIELVKTVAGQLDINHAGFDVAVVDGYPYLIEFNRLFGNQGIQDRHGLQNAILEYLLTNGKPENPDNDHRDLPTPPLDQVI